MTDSMILHLEDLEKRYFSYFFNTLILSGDIYDQLYCCRTRWFYRCNTPLSYRINSRLWNHPVSRQNIFYQYHWLHCYRSRCFACLKRLSSKSKACSFLKDWNLWGFTTFSTFALESATLMKSGHPKVAFLYMLLSILVGVGAIFITDLIQIQ